MNTKKEAVDGQKKVSNGASELIAEAKLMCGVYAEDMRLLREGKSGEAGENLKLFNQPQGEVAMKFLMEIIKNIDKVKQLSTTDTTEHTKTDEGAQEKDGKIVNIQDLALSKNKA